MPRPLIPDSERLSRRLTVELTRGERARLERASGGTDSRRLSALMRSVIQGIRYRSIDTRRLRSALDALVMHGAVFREGAYENYSDTGVAQALESMLASTRQLDSALPAAPKIAVPRGRLESRVTFRVTVEEHSRVTALAAQRGTSIVNAARAALAGAELLDGAAIALLQECWGELGRQFGNLKSTLHQLDRAQLPYPRATAAPLKQAIVDVRNQVSGVIDAFVPKSAPGRQQMAPGSHQQGTKGGAGVPAVAGGAYTGTNWAPTGHQPSTKHPLLEIGSVL